MTKFSFPNFQQLDLRFHLNDVSTLVSKLFRKTSYLGTSTGNAIYTPLCCSSWPNVNLLYLLIVDFTAASHK